MIPTARSRCFALLFLAAALGPLASPVHAWWNDQWSQRKKITVDTGAAGVPIHDPIGSVAVLIRLHDGDFQFSSAKNDGSDLRFVAADDKTLLPYHVEKFDVLLDEAFVWVKVPDLQPGETRSFWLYYGNSSAPAVADSKATYDADTVLVYHFGEQGQPPRDSSPAGNDGQVAGNKADGAIIGTGLRLDGRSGLTLPVAPSLVWSAGGAMTWSAWVDPSGVRSPAILFSRDDGEREFSVGLDRDIPYVEVKDVDGVHRSSSGRPILAGQWRHWAVVAAGPQIQLYLDGEVYAALAAPLPALATAAQLGRNGADRVFSGEMDELEISRIARPAGAIKFAAVNQGGEGAAKLLVLGEDEQKKDWLSWLKSGYFGIILGSLTLDGWVVIGILAIMAVISWAVMIRKAIYLNATARSNAAFMREWHHLASDLTALDHGDAEKTKTMGGRVDRAGLRAIRAASVYRIYHIGAEEIRHRLAGKGADGPKVLSARSIQAIRSSLDGGLVRETQKLNSSMVLLTIAISGGPFLGLLGTVVGVMITFAAIAAAGDVNVNAIAPGIAAALVATVAGLAVAIPALFGYNYLLSRVKDSISDMQVFADEFVSKMAEFYSEPKS